MLAGLIDKLKATKEADGSSLFDHVALAFGSNISSIHYLDNCPTVLTGGGANLKLGQHLVLSKDTPLCNVWLTMRRDGYRCRASWRQHGCGEGIAGVVMMVRRRLSAESNQLSVNSSQLDRLLNTEHRLLITGFLALWLCAFSHAALPKLFCPSRTVLSSKPIAMNVTIRSSRKGK